MAYELGQGTGPLRGIRVVELAGIGPAPHACMILADLGADVIRIDRPGGGLLGEGPHDLLTRGRPSVALDLKDPASTETVLELVARADILVEGMRPGTTERLGLGPEVCLARNPSLIYGRMTGWGQDGPLAQAAGHDMNYVAVAGALYGLGQDPARPQFPSNLLGDFGGGSTYLVIGLLAALLEARLSGQGQVVDAAIVDGTAHLNALGAALHAAGQSDRRVGGILNGAEPYYDVYETADGEHLAVAAIEPSFYATLTKLLELPDDLPARDDPTQREALRAALAERFKERTRAEWAAVFDGTDACVSGVLRLQEAFHHPHNTARGVFVEHEGIVQPAPAPRFSRTRPTLTTGPITVGAQTEEALAAWGVRR
ncbi:MAG: CaiB/BaiF CoA-transferase family protein [Nocardioides sp.]|uniref:CaiB/BaiF CoA transferase family protein n=1 Tax=Nocardioides sp. TaxID=35761 RepID=UPI0039E3149F